MPRLTRSESQARTRAQLLATAKELFLRDGYATTSLEKVADAAGFSKGAVYSNFRNKDQLCMAVLDEIRAERAAEILQLAQDGTLEERLQRFEAWAEVVIGDPAWTTLELEFGVQTRRNTEMRTEFGGRIGGFADLIESGLTMAAEAEGITPKMPMDEIAVALLCLGVGLGLFRAIYPSLPVTALTNTVRVMAGVPVTTAASATAVRPSGQ